MRTVRQICAITFLTIAFSTFAFGEEEGWIGTGNKPPKTTTSMTPSDETPELIITETGEESSYFDELYEATLFFLQMNLL
jgi:hypothetical protein